MQNNQLFLCEDYLLVSVQKKLENLLFTQTEKCLKLSRVSVTHLNYFCLGLENLGKQVHIFGDKLDPQLNSSAEMQRNVFIAGFTCLICVRS